MLCAACGEPTEHDRCTLCGEAAILVGRYRLTQVIGRGSSGLTYRASPVAGGPDVAVKEMMYVRARAPKQLELIRREVAVLAQLRHPRIPRFIEAFDAGAGKARALCLVQEFVAGSTLAEEAHARRYTEAEVLDAVAGVAEVLEYIHGLQPPVIHRDLKPGNLIRDASGALVLIDFGCVRDQVKDDVVGGSTLAIGTYGYMAPEQLVGDASPASDLYALGALALWLLSRRDPASLLGPAADESWRSVIPVSADTRALLSELVEPDPARRQGSARAVRERAHALARAIREGGAPTSSVTASDRAARPARSPESPPPPARPVVPPALAPPPAVRLPSPPPTSLIAAPTVVPSPRTPMVIQTVVPRAVALEEREAASARAAARSNALGGTTWLWAGTAVLAAVTFAAGFPAVAGALVAALAVAVLVSMMTRDH